MTRPFLYKKRNAWQQACWLMDCSTWELVVIIGAAIYQVYLIGCLVQLRGW